MRPSDLNKNALSMELYTQNDTILYLQKYFLFNSFLVNKDINTKYILNLFYNNFIINKLTNKFIIKKLIRLNEKLDDEIKKLKTTLRLHFYS